MGLTGRFDERIAELEARAAGGAADGFDVWDRAEADYLRAVRERLAGGEDAADVRAWLAGELPRLEEEVAREEACPTFDWYDEHYHEKICSGRLAACRTALSLCEEDAR